MTLPYDTARCAAETVECLKKTATVGGRIVEVLPNAENKRLRAFLTTIAYTGLTGADAAEHAAEALNAGDKPTP